MLIRLLIWFFQFCLLTPKAYSFRTPKHDILFYYKTQGSVSLTNPFNHTTSYGIYVAGQTITVDIPKSVVALSDILDWKVVNLNKDRLMFVHKKKAEMLIDQQSIKQMNYSGELSDSIIAFGDNEALHVPTILNPDSKEPLFKWNYIELLYFDDQSEKVSVIRSLPWLKDDDWKYIKEWKMMDYLHFDDKLYLLILRSIWNEESGNVAQEISIIRMCLDKGSELISSAVEIRSTKPEFETNPIIDLVFFFIFTPTDFQLTRYQLHAVQLQSFSNIKLYQTYVLSDIVSAFEETANECASGSGNINLLRDHLRSQVGKCLKTNNENCSTKENIVPSKSGFLVQFDLYDNVYVSFQSIESVFHKLQFCPLPYPYLSSTTLTHTKPITSTLFCAYSPNNYCNNYIEEIPPKYEQTDFYTNKNPFGIAYVDKETNEYFFHPIRLCSVLKTCAQCIMYGIYSDCIWSKSRCVFVNQPKNKKALTLNNCFKIIAFSPLIFNSSSPTNLTIQLDRPLRIQASQEHLVVQAGDNHCSKITFNGSSINCTLNLLESGKFKIHVSLQNYRYSDATFISAVSSDKVHIDVSKGQYMIVLLFLGLVIGLLLLIAYKFRKANKMMSEALEIMISKTMSNEKTKSFQSLASTTRMTVPSDPNERS